MRTGRTPLVICVSVCAAVLGSGQQRNVALPTVASANVPLYPPVARAARVEGTVQLQVSTDGQRVTEAHVDGGNKLLADAAAANVRTWSFATHEPTSFAVTFRYKLLPASRKQNGNNPIVVLRLPIEVDVSIPRLPPLD